MRKAFKTKQLGKLDRPVFIVGMWPNRQHKDQETGVVWEGNRSGNFMMRIINGRSNIFLTNIVNMFVDYPSDQELLKGKKNLIRDIIKYKPRLILGFGAWTCKQLDNMRISVPIIEFSHPAAIIRFTKRSEGTKRKEEYCHDIREAIDKALRHE
jgi:hypothetical protein